MAGVDVRGLERELRASVRGDVGFDAGHRAAFAHDASNYRQVPLGVVAPLDADDAVAAVAVARAHGAPVLPRGCGTSLSGETVNAALVLDTSRHMRRIVELDPQRRLARVEPGVIRDELAGALEREHHLTFGPDTSTHAYATIGGMLGNNSCGVHSLTAGRTSDNTHALDVLLYDGTRMAVGPTPPAAGGRAGEVHARLRDLAARHAGAIRAAFPDIPRRVSGYNLDELLPERGFHVARALVGSEGTLATILEATLQLVEHPPHRTLVVLGFDTVIDAADRVPDVLACGPSALEGMDMRLVRDRSGLPSGGGWLLAEFTGWTQAEAADAARRCAVALGRRGGAVEVVAVTDPAQARRVWRARELASAAVEGTAPGWEDAAVAPARLGDYLRDFQALLDAHGYRTVLYGHFGDGCVHSRIDFDLQTPGGVRAWRRFLDEAADLVVAYGGSLSGEHGDGQARAELLPRMFGDDVVRAFEEMKAILDPDGGMNPGKVVAPRPITSDLKPRVAGAPPCVGAGVCRKLHAGTMCPSYMATRDERHSTRGRARVLAEMLQGETITDGYRSEAVHAALDLCLSCKACKSECPAGVDIAAHKAEFLARHYARRLRPRQAYSMGLIMYAARAARLAPGAANALAASAAGRRLAGVTAQRPLPRFARESFRAAWARRPAGGAGSPPVVLLADTFNDHFQPEVLHAAARALAGAGLSVQVPEGFVCCGRPLYDFGMLATARRLLRGLVARLGPAALAGTPIAVAEPSCLSTLRDELPRMLPRDAAARAVAARAVTLAEALTGRDWAPPSLDGRTVLLHGHCHQVATGGPAAEPALLERAGADVRVLDAGCCGMAGPFGYDRAKYELSMRIGEQRLLPAVRAADAGALVVADGFSCRAQVEHGTGRRALHLAQVLAGTR
ncbi:MAG TPA: FAD-binding and (Fe-S)-binding domain-containing protein [Solirubrobacteraceae bacterium]|nr:FAD-binding and (Fe-S)-binding domain-containing protein [Solirubrobacteraceae bacterium]